MSAAVACEGLVHIYKGEGLEVVALQGLDLQVEAGEAVAIVGRSGSGKTTLMNVLGALETPTAGKAVVAGCDLTALRPGRADRYRRDVVGYVWQEAGANLAGGLHAAANVELPMLGAGVAAAERRRRADELLGRLGLAARRDHLPAELSGGEQQRLAIAVALANRPRVLLADEPTAELDSATAAGVLGDLRRLQRELGLTVVVVTHDRQVEHHVDRVVAIRDGRTSTETRYLEQAGIKVPDELVIVDRAGRLQIPRGHLDAVRLRGRARLHVDRGRIVIEPVDSSGSD
jgi:putative ABC transport system ATP-binding protein